MVKKWIKKWRDRNKVILMPNHHFQNDQILIKNVGDHSIFIDMPSEWGFSDNDQKPEG